MPSASTTVLARVARGLSPLVLLASLGLGCVAQVPYTRDDEMVTRLGDDAAQRQMSDVLYRAVDPRVGNVEFKDNAITVTWNQPQLGPYGVHVGYIPVQRPLFLAGISKVEVYENNRVFVYGPAGSIDHQITFANIQDAQLFAQLLWSFKAKATS